MEIQQLKKQLKISALAFAYAATSIAPVMADDSEIYIGGVSNATTGNPNVMMLIDTSGSMDWGMHTTSTQSTTSKKRITHLKTAVKSILQTLPGNINVGLAVYNANGAGGRILYPLSRLDGDAQDNPDGSSDRIFSASNNALNDVEQSRAVDPLVTNNDTLTVGGRTEEFTMAVSANGAVQYSSGATTYVGGGGQKGLYLNNYPVKTGTGTTTVYQQSNLGLRFPNITLPPDALVTSATLILTKAGDVNTQPSGWTGTPDSNEAITLRVSLQNTATSPVVFDSASNKVNDRTYTAATDITIPADDSFAADGAKLEIDVSSIVSRRIAGTLAGAGAWTAGNALAFRLEGRSGNGGYTTKQVCVGSKWWGCNKYETQYDKDAPKIRRIYGYHDAPAKAPKLLITYSSPALSRDQVNAVGVRFMGVDVPQGATINSAYLEFTASQTSANTAAHMYIAIDKNDPTYINSPEFDATNHLWSTRWGQEQSAMTYVAAGVGTTDIPRWTKDSVYQLDVKTLLQNRVNSNGSSGSGVYCGAKEDAGVNAVAFRLTTTGGGEPSRQAYSYEGNAGKAPKLVVNFTPPTGSSCSQIRRTYSPGASADDARQDGTNKNTIGDESIQLTSTAVGALRFGSIQIPKDSSIVSAKLTLKSAADLGAGSRGVITIKTLDTEDTQPFNTNNSGKISGMTKSAASVSWNMSGWTTKNVSYTSPDISSLLQSLVNKTGWVAGNAFGLVLSHDKNSGPAFWTWDKKGSNIPILEVIYRSTALADSTFTKRDKMVQLVNDLTLDSGTPLNEAYYEVARYMMGMTADYGVPYAASAPAGLWTQSGSTYTYVSPVGQATCQSNNLIMLTDGEPTNLDTDKKARLGGTGECTATPKSRSFSYTYKNENGQSVTKNSDTYDSLEVCSKHTAKYLLETGRDGASIKTYTIGFGPVTQGGSQIATWLTDVASAGGGDFFAATDSDSLAASFQSIFARIADSNGAMASPGVAVNQMNRTQHLDELYYGVFKPKTTERWPGNLKRYRLDTSDIKVVDSVGAAAIDPDTKYFSVNAKSYWGNGEVDGNEADKGGAAAKITSELKVYSNVSNTSNIMQQLTTSNLMGLTTDQAKWVLGYDVNNETGAGATGFRKAMGAPMHAQPTMLAVNTSGDYIVFVGTNDGLLHAISNSTGQSYWAWMPSDLRGNVPDLMANNGMGASGKPIYGLDGMWTMVDLGTTGKRLLVGGMRQGGSNYYALEVATNPAVAPVLKWAIRPSTTGFSRLANTWSQPQFAYVRINGTITPVVIFGGGLDYAKYETGGASAQAGTGTDSGNAVYMVDATNGDLIWWGSSSATTGTKATKVNDMKYSVPGGVRVVDKDGDGLADHLYFGDVGGQVFRVDIDNKTKVSGQLVVKRVALLAQLGNAESNTKSDDRRFYETPAVDYAFDGNNKLYAAVAIGSGNRNFPSSDKSVDDRIFVIRDYDAARFDILDAAIDANGKGTGTAYPDLDTYAGTGGKGPVKTAGLADVTGVFGSTAAANALAKRGWYIDLPKSGEKVLSSPFIFSRKVNGVLEYQVNFNTYAPDSSSASACSPVTGATNAWTIQLASGTSVTNTSASTTMDDRYSEAVASGITGSGVPMVIDKDGDNKGDTLIELTGTGAQERGAVPAGLGKIQRTRWYDKRSN